LSAIAAMVDNEVLCHAFGDGKTMVLLDQSLGGHPKPASRGRL